MLAVGELASGDRFAARALEALDGKSGSFTTADDQPVLLEAHQLAHLDGRVCGLTHRLSPENLYRLTPQM
jgi:hypothetical protein